MYGKGPNNYEKDSPMITRQLCLIGPTSSFSLFRPYTNHPQPSKPSACWTSPEVEELQAAGRLSVGRRDP